MTISSGSSAAGGEQFHVLFAVSVEGCFGDFLEQDVGLAVNHPITLVNDRLADGLSQVTFAGAGWDLK